MQPLHGGCALLVCDFGLCISIGVVDHSIEGLVDPLTSNHLESSSVCVCTCACTCVYVCYMYVCMCYMYARPTPHTKCMMTAYYANDLCTAYTRA